jgi:signal transduction histidine kinase
MDSRDLLRRSTIFASLPEKELDRLVELSPTVLVQPGEVLMTEGSRGGSVHLALDGDFEITKRSGQQEIVLARRGPGEIFGEISLLDESPRTASVRALTPGRLLVISQDAFRQALMENPLALLAILRTITARLRNTESMLRQSEKMASLGTLAAGLAHELNNPAAAARSAASNLANSFEGSLRAEGRLARLDLNAEQFAAASALRSVIAERWQSTTGLDPLDQSDREADTQSWLESRGIEPAWELAATLVSGGLDSRGLDDLSTQFTAIQIITVIPWLAAGIKTSALLGEVVESLGRVSEIVKAVRAYSFLDQAEIQNVDLRQGIENTLVILRHKIGPGVIVKRDFSTDLPPIEAYGSSLNQVWTNLVDNALDAVAGHGTIQIRAFAADGLVIVEVSDDGPGIPDEIQSRIFDPFFTTKPPGASTGLGLHISYNIVVHTHRGQIQVTSRPGNTMVQVVLPTRLKRLA